MAIAWVPTYNGRIGGTTEFLVAGVLVPYVVKSCADGLRILFTDTGVYLTKLPSTTLVPR